MTTTLPTPDTAGRVSIGYPAATDFDFAELAPLMGRKLLNNVGDPYTDGASPGHTKPAERQVVEILADLFRAGDHRWGYVTTGATEGNLWALREARRRYPDGLVIHTTAAHYSVPKAVDLLAMPSVVVATDDRGEMDYTDLRRRLTKHPGRSALVVATAGTTMTEACDDLRQITAVLDDIGVPARYVHVDAALAGIPLALLEPDQRPGFDLADGANSIVVSGHKFLGTPMPCGVLVTTAAAPTQAPVSYIGSPDTTITGSRNGHAPLILRAALQRHGLTGLRHRAEQARALAAHTVDRLTEIGWPARRNQHAFTVVLDRPPPPAVAARWSIPTENRRSHIVCMPGLTQHDLDRFVNELRNATRRQQRAIPRQRTAIGYRTSDP
ncbi:histidine decarboxylase [Polymorphospora sp. NPDC051019]|uniref:histidine decarboxylase n=1 Tax=Polymorphospora sp. NPDC051019 TaxID=3155725 RepID=UPI003428F4FB